MANDITVPMTWPRVNYEVSGVIRDNLSHLDKTHTGEVELSNVLVVIGAGKKTKVMCTGEVEAAIAEILIHDAEVFERVMSILAGFAALSGDKIPQCPCGRVEHIPFDKL